MTSAPAPARGGPALRRGRFAPSPTGPLHFGSLLAAVGSHLQARSGGGEWYVRMEDVDTARCVPGAADAILRDLERAGMFWDGSVLRQSARGENYREALARLDRTGWTYACGCSRRDLLQRIYPGTCRGGLPSGRRARSVRVRVPEKPVGFHDRVQGWFEQALEASVGDFVLYRADRVYAYHLAVVVDDAAQGITEIVRGSDLMDSTPRQIHLQRLLGLPGPSYAHLPVALNRQGQKLSKQTRAAPLPAGDLVPVLHRALDLLGQQPPAALPHATLDEFWAWAIRNWRLERVPRVMGIGVE